MTCVKESRLFYLKIVHKSDKNISTNSLTFICYGDILPFGMNDVLCIHANMPTSYEVKPRRTGGALAGVALPHIIDRVKSSVF